MDKREQLRGLLNDDPYNLLQITETAHSAIRAEDTVLKNNFEDIVSFYEENGKEPSSNLSNIYEYQLYCRLKVIRETPSMVKILKPLDLYGLLNNSREMVLEEVIASDPYDLLKDSGGASDIFQMRNVKPAERIHPDFIARRRQCKDFEQYKILFDNLLQELETGKRKLALYKSDDLKEHGFYVLNGVLVYLSKVDGSIENYEFQSGDRERFDGRTMCIFDNGTCSEMLFRSLDKALQRDGYCISDQIHNNRASISITDDDKSLGYIYVLKSLHPRLRGERDIYKIGCTTSSVSERIKNAKNEATYLYSDVEIIETYRCYNISAHEVEQSIHSFLDSVRLDIDIPIQDGSLAKPREWFNVKLDVIDEIVELLQNNTINSYVYDKRSGRILQK